MFLLDKESRNYWLSQTSTEFREFELIGTILGLAIYNSVILDIHFPQIMYKKLMGQESSDVEDLRDVSPELYRGMKTLLTFDGNVEEVYARNFRVEYEVFGAKVKSFQRRVENFFLSPLFSFRNFTILNRTVRIFLSPMTIALSMLRCTRITTSTRACQSSSLLSRRASISWCTGPHLACSSPKSLNFSFAEIRCWISRNWKRRLSTSLTILIRIIRQVKISSFFLKQSSFLSIFSLGCQVVLGSCSWAQGRREEEASFLCHGFGSRSDWWFEELAVDHSAARRRRWSFAIITHMLQSSAASGIQEQRCVEIKAHVGVGVRLNWILFDVTKIRNDKWIGVWRVEKLMYKLRVRQIGRKKNFLLGTRFQWSFLRHKSLSSPNGW